MVDEQNRDDRIISAEHSKDEDFLENSLRPVRLTDFVGQHSIKKNMNVFIKAALNRNEALDHVLLLGPPGLGKTTLANIVANEMNTRVVSTSGPVIEKTGDLAAILTNLEEKEVLFIDEIHRLSPVIEEVLYPAMEDFKLDIVVGEGPAARTIRLDTAPFTLVGATTRAGLLTSPLRDRFGIVHHFNYYNEEDLEKIVVRSAGILNCPVKKGGAEEIARRSRGTPRVANRLLRRVRDFAEVEGNGIIDRSIACDALAAMEVDEFGFHELDRRILLSIIEKFDGGPVGLNTISASVGEDRDSLEDVYEPFLIQIGFLERTPRGRKVTALAYKHFGYDQTKEVSTNAKLWE